jgi:hypothetical protein
MYEDFGKKNWRIFEKYKDYSRILKLWRIFEDL